VSPNIACAVDRQSHEGWATMNALQFLESEPRINILTIRPLIKSYQVTELVTPGENA
jgi:hypothetical protein